MININKRNTAPESLAEEKAKPNGSYKKKDVIDALREDANNKCYLCEDWAPTSIHVEHFEEHRGNKDKKFDWNNLFYSCAHCNLTKAATFPRTVSSSDLLNCTLDECKVDLWVYHELSNKNLKTEVIVKQNPRANVTPYEQQTANTVKLLDRIFNGSGIEDKAASLNAGAENLRTKINEELKYFKFLTLKYCEASTPDEKETNKHKIEESIDSAKPFLSFKHWILRKNNIATEFGIE